MQDNNKRRRDRTNKRLSTALKKVEKLEALVAHNNTTGRRGRMEQAVLLRMAGNTNAQVAEAMGLESGTISQYMSEWVQWCKDRPNSHELQTGLLTYLPNAHRSLEGLLDDHHPATTIAYLQGIQALANKQEVQVVRDTSPTEDQFTAIGEFAKAHPVYRKLLMDAMGLSPGANAWANMVQKDSPSGSGEAQAGSDEGQSGSVEGQGILNEPDPGTPEPPEDRDV